MSKFFKTVAAGALLFVSLSSAGNAAQSPASDMHHSRMGTPTQHGGMMDMRGMKGKGGKMQMGRMMAQMDRMMASCNKMTQRGRHHS